MRNIMDLLPEKEKMILVQARVNSELVIKVKQVMEQKQLSWADVLGACLQAFVNEAKRPK